MWKKTKLDRQISWTTLQFTSACTSLQAGIAYINKLSLLRQKNTGQVQIELKLKNDKGALRAGVSTQLIISAEEVTAHLVSPALLSLNDEGIIGIKIIEEKNKVKFIPADIVLASDEGVYIAGLPFTSTIITVGQGYVKSGMRVNLISESDTEATLAAQREKQGQ